MKIRDARPTDLDRLLELYAEVAGTLVLAVLPNLAHGGAPSAVIENVVVDEEYRGAGAGEALMEEAMGRARRAGAYKLALCSNTGREESRVGFEVRR